MICQEIHRGTAGNENEIVCNQAVPDAGKWKYCPRCGRPLGALLLPEDAGKFRVAQESDGKQTRNLRLEMRGLTNVRFRAGLEGYDRSNPQPRVRIVQNGVEIEPDREIEFTATPDLRASIQLRLPSLRTEEGEVMLGKVRITTDDFSSNSDRRPHPWKPPVEESRYLPLRAFVETPARIELDQEAALFPPRTQSRKITLRNIGGQDTQLTEIVLPTGFAVAGDNSLPLLTKLDQPKGFAVAWDNSLPLPMPLPKGEARTITLKLERRAEAPANAEIKFIFADNSDKPVLLPVRVRKGNGPRSLPQAVVGIDFGTAFTTVALRICGIGMERNPPKIDPVIFLTPPDSMQDVAQGQDNNPATRFRTRVWVGDDGSFAFGEAAQQRYENSASSGFLLREIKTLLREPRRLTEFWLGGGYPPDQAEPLLRREHGENWAQTIVTNYLRWLRDTMIRPEMKNRFPNVSPNVVYVFSLPVLDYGAGEGGADAYDHQKAQMTACIRAAGFDMDKVQFQFEPVCAVFALLYPTDTDNPDTPVLGGNKPIESNDKVLLLDSGGGTTDIVLLQARLDGEQLRMEVLRCLGVDSQTHTFGGEMVTTRLLRALSDPGKVPGSANEWLDGLANPDWLIADEEFDSSDSAPADTNESDPIVVPPATGSDLLDLDAVPVESEGDVRNLRDRAEHFKRILSRTPAERKVDILDVIPKNRQNTLRDGITSEESMIKPVLLDRLVKDKLDSLRTQLKTAIFKSLDPASGIRYYISVGGNSRLRPFQVWVNTNMKDGTGERELHLPSLLTTHGVAYGAVWVPDARLRSTLPYTLRLEYGQEVIQTYSANTTSDLDRPSNSYSLEHGDSLSLTLRAEWGDGTSAQGDSDSGSFIVARHTIHNDKGEVQYVNLIHSLQEGRLAVSVQRQDSSDDSNGSAGNDNEQREDVVLEYVV